VKFGIRREELDEFSVESQERALTATEKGYFRNEIVELPELQKDEGI
jgi:Acetyl-CoA acetyltransferase